MLTKVIILDADNIDFFSISTGVPAHYFLDTVFMNINNIKMNDAEFRLFIWNTLPVIDFHDRDSIVERFIKNKKLSIKDNNSFTVFDPADFLKNISDVVPASNFLGTLAANILNEDLSNSDFRKLIWNTLPIVVFGAKERASEILSK